MKHKRLLGLLLTGALLIGAAAVAADPGGRGDSLIALNWLKEVFIPQTINSTEAHIEAKTDDLYQEALELPSAVAVEMRVKRGDVISLSTGSSIMSMAGIVSGQISGTLVDVTDGTESAGSLQLTARHRYLAAEQTSAQFSIQSDTAVVRLNGHFKLLKSSSMDYNAVADALRKMGLFMGSDSGYGSGYDLEKEPTRIQGLIMFLRLIGEEDKALSYVGNVAFSDVPEWALPYASYAFDMGYMNGMGTDEQWRVIFGTNRIMTPRDYMTFLLRALGYAERIDFNWETAVEDAQHLNVLTSGEAAMLEDGSVFLRAQVAYLSYVALSAQYPGAGLTLLDHLIASGSVASRIDAGIIRF